MNVIGNQRFAAHMPTPVFADQRAGHNAVFGEQRRAASRAALRTFGVQRTGGNAVFGEQMRAPST